MLTLESELLTSLFAAIDVGLVILDDGGKIAAWNDWMAGATGSSSDAVRGKRLDEVFPGAVNRRLMVAVDDALASGSSSILTHSLHKAVFPLLTRAGRKMIHNVAVRRVAGVPVRCLVQVFDVTVAVERDRMLRERQNARYDAVVDSAPDAILTLDIKGIIQLANPAAGRVLDYSKEELTGQPIGVLFNNQAPWQKAWADVLAGKPMTCPIELTASKKSGLPCIVEVSMAAWQSETRRFVTAILRDVSERRRAAEALQDLNQTLERRVAERTAERDRIWRLSSEVMLVAQPDGTLIDANPAGMELLGQPAAQSRLVDFVLPEDKYILERELRDLRNFRAPSRFELRHLLIDGSVRCIEWSAVLVDNILQAVGRDVTAERDAETALRNAEDALRQSQKMEAIGQLTGGIAHDFNNLLAGISGSLELLELRLGQNRLAESGQLIGIAQESAQRAAALTHRLLAFSRRQTLAPKPTDLNQLVTGINDLVQRTVGPSIELMTIAGDPLWGILVDPNQLENALLNLCINARDAMPDGGRLTIETQNITLDERAAHERDMLMGQYVVLRITDTGIGMAQDVVERAFDPFFTTKPTGEGTGLGLSMVYGFARQSGGQARIHSRIGLGTSVAIYLPRYAGETESVQEAAQPPALEHAADGETVLVVDDEAAIRMFVAEVLTDLEYKMIEAENGKSALQILESNRRVDLLITDVGLPGGLNGRQLADAGRVLRPDLKVIFITGYAESAATGAGKLQPGMHIVTKPFAIDVLASRVTAILADG